MATLKKEKRIREVIGKQEEIKHSKCYYDYTRNMSIDQIKAFYKKQAQEEIKKQIVD